MISLKFYLISGENIIMNLKNEEKLNNVDFINKYILGITGSANPIFFGENGNNFINLYYVDHIEVLKND